MANDDDQNQGRGWHGDPQGHAEAGSQSSGNQGNEEQHAEAGKMGGEATAETHDSTFYSEIGRKGGQNQGQENNPGNFANDPDKAQRAGQKGGSR